MTDIDRTQFPCNDSTPFATPLSRMQKLLMHPAFDGCCAQLPPSSCPLQTLWGVSPPNLPFPPAAWSLQVRRSILLLPFLGFPDFPPFLSNHLPLSLKTVSPNDSSVKGPSSTSTKINPTATTPSPTVIELSNGVPGSSVSSEAPGQPTPTPTPTPGVIFLPLKRLELRTFKPVDRTLLPVQSPCWRCCR